MSQHCFLTKAPSEHPAWRQAFPNLILCSDTAQHPDDVADVLWILSTVENWEALVLHYQEKSARVIVLSMQPNIEEAFRAFSAGARGYAHAWSSPLILKQIDVVTEQNGLWIGPDMLKGLMLLSQKSARAPSSSKTSIINGLSDREREVAEQVAQGLTNKEVARKLSITERTVKAHLGAIFRKLGIRDRVQLVLHLKSQSS